MFDGTPGSIVPGENTLYNYGGNIGGKVKIGNAFAFTGENQSSAISNPFYGFISGIAILVSPQSTIGNISPQDLSASKVIFNENESVDYYPFFESDQPVTFVVAYYAMDSIPIDLVTGQNILIKNKNASGIKSFYEIDKGSLNKAIPTRDNFLLVKNQPGGIVSDIDYSDHDMGHEGYPSQFDLWEILSIMTLAGYYLSLFLNLKQSVISFTMEQFTLCNYRELLRIPQLQEIREMSKIKSDPGKAPEINLNDDFVPSLLHNLCILFNKAQGIKRPQNIASKAKCAINHKWYVGCDKMYSLFFIGEMIFKAFFNAPSVLKEDQKLAKQLKSDAISTIKNNLLTLRKKQEHESGNQSSVEVLNVCIDSSFEIRDMPIRPPSSMPNMDDSVLSISQLSDKLKRQKNKEEVKYGTVMVKLCNPTKGNNDKKVKVKVTMYVRHNINVINILEGEGYVLENDIKETPIILNKASQFIIPTDPYVFKFVQPYFLMSNVGNNGRKNREYCVFPKIYTIPDSPTEAIYRPDEGIKLLTKMMNIGASYHPRSFTTKITTKMAPSEETLRTAIETVLEYIFSHPILSYNTAGNIPAENNIFSYNENDDAVYHIEKYYTRVEECVRQEQRFYTNCGGLTAHFLFFINLVCKKDPDDIQNEVSTHSIQIDSNNKKIGMDSSKFYSKWDNNEVGTVSYDLMGYRHNEPFTYLSFGNHIIPLIQRDSRAEVFSFGDPTFKANSNYIVGIDCALDPTKKVPAEYLLAAFAQECTVPEHDLYTANGKPVSIENPRILETAVKDYNFLASRAKKRFHLVQHPIDRNAPENLKEEKTEYVSLFSYFPDPLPQFPELT